MKDEQAFLGAIVEDPFDLDVRRVFSDWLEENNQEARAQFIRAQLAIHELTKEQFLVLPESPRGQRIDQLKKYCRDLEKAAGGILNLIGLTLHDCAIYYESPEHGMPGMMLEGAKGPSKGFYEALSLNWNAFLGTGWQFVQKQPITEIHISDAVPGNVSVFDRHSTFQTGAWPTSAIELGNQPDNIVLTSKTMKAWTRTKTYPQIEWEVPEEIWNEMYLIGKTKSIDNQVLFDTEILARQALSHACVNWSRLKCGMKRLEWKS